MGGKQGEDKNGLGGNMKPCSSFTYQATMIKYKRKPAADIIFNITTLK